MKTFVSLSLVLLACSAGSAGQTTIESQLLAEMNRLRKDPAAFVAVLEEYKSHFKGNRLEMPGEIALMTNEGAAAVEEAIDFVRSAEPLPEFVLSKGMSRAAADHVRDLTASGNVGHYGSDGSDPSTRARRYGAWKKTIGENIAMGSKTGRRMLFQLLIDDGVPGRGHRKNLFRPVFRVVGIACGKHPVYRTVCVIDLAGGFAEAEQPE